MPLNFAVAPFLAFALSALLAHPNCPVTLQPRAPSRDFASDIRSVEKEGCFEQALDLLQQHSSELDDSQRTHLAHLRAYVEIQISNSDDTLLASDRSKALEELLAKFDRVSDVYLLYDGRKQLNILDAKAVSFSGSRFGQFLSRVAESRRQKDVWSFPVTTAWVLVAPGLALLAFIYLLWRFWPRRSGFLISFEDLTAEPSSKAHRDRILTQEIQEAFWVPRADHMFREGDLRVFAINDHDGSSFATLIPQKTLVVWSDIMQANMPIKVGPIEFNVKQLFALFLGWLQSPTRHALVGSLHEGEGQTVITAQRLNRRRRLVAGCSWKVQAESGPHAQHDLISELAAQMLVDLGGTTLTRSWRSYRSLLRGIVALDQRPPARDSCNCFGVARQQLWSALEEDPANWMARFYLAIALRRCSANEEAARHLAEVAQLFAKAEKRLSGRLPFDRWWGSKSLSFLERHLWKYPQCALIVLYNRAMALSKLHNSDAMYSALSLLSHIVILCDGRNPGSQSHVHDHDIPDIDGFRLSVSRLTEVDQRRFACVARSAQTVVWAAQAEYLCPEIAGSPKQLLSEIEKVERHIRASVVTRDSIGSGSPWDDSGSLDLALATVLCAKGKVQTILDQLDQARESFDHAILLAPNLVDTQISLAASYVNNPGKGSSWIRIAEDALQKALKFDPDCPKAFYWLARLEYHRTPPNYDQALKKLERIENLPEGLFLRAEIFASAAFPGRNLNSSIKDWSAGLEGLPLVVSLDQAHHLETLQKLAKDHPGICELQTIAAQAAKHVDENCAWQSRKWRARAEKDNHSGDGKVAAAAASA